MIELESYTNEDNMKTVLMQYDNGTYGIKIIDIDSGEMLPTVLKYEDKDKAYDKYNKLKV